MAFTDEQKKILTNNGYTQSSKDPDKYINRHHSIASREGTTIFNTDHHSSNGKNITNKLFDKKAW